MNQRNSVSIALAVMLAAGTTWAHHNMSALFDFNQRFTRTGTLTKSDWRNPHIQFFLEAKGDKGQAESWLIEGGPPNRFASRKISKADFEKAIGQTVTVEVEVSADRDRPRYASLYKITFPDGRVVVNRRP